MKPYIHVASRAASGILQTAMNFLLFASLASADVKFYIGAEHPTAGAVPADFSALFDRVSDLAPGATLSMRKAIANSTTLLTGTVIVKTAVKGCWSYDWTTTVLGEESSNVVVFGPSDVSIFCDTPAASPAVPTTPPTLDQVADLYIVIPMRAKWVEISSFLGNLNDPARKTPAPIPSDFPYCWDNSTSPPTRIDTNRTSIAPCDRNLNLLTKTYYRDRWIYNRLTVPGQWSGSFSLAPAVVQKGTQTLTEDIRFYGSSETGPGWLGLSVIFEKGATVPSNLDSLTSTITYDFHLGTQPWWVPLSNEGIGIRPGELTISTGAEFAPSEAKSATGTHEGRDLNLVEGIYYKQPISITALRFPSFITLFPLVGAEGGWHFIRYQAGESAQFFRKVVGVDASMRYPFHAAPNFTSTKPATLDYTFRERFLSGSEPYADTFPVGAMGNLLPVTPILSRQRRDYSRIAVTWPFSSYVALNAAVQRGSLPPDFASVAWTFTVGLVFASTGTAEH